MAAANIANTQLPIFKEGDRVTLAPGVSLRGELRYESGLTKSFQPNSPEIFHNASEGLTYTIFARELRNVSTSTPNPQDDPMMQEYRLVLLTDIVREVEQVSAPVKVLVNHTNLKAVDAPLGAKHPNEPFEAGDKASLNKLLRLQPNGSTVAAPYKAGTQPKIMQLCSTVKGKPPPPGGPVERVNYVVRIVEETLLKRDVFWRASVKVSVTSLQAAA